MPKLNYDTHNKELLVIFEAYKTWHHYLEGPAFMIDVVTNHKPDALTRCWDVYPKEGDRGFAQVNPQNLQLVFTAEQLTDSLGMTYLHTPVLRASALMDIACLHANILANLPSDLIAKAHLLDTLNP